MAKDRAVHGACFLFPHLGLKREKCLRFFNQTLQEETKAAVDGLGIFYQGVLIYFPY